MQRISTKVLRKPLLVSGLGEHLNSVDVSLESALKDAGLRSTAADDGSSDDLMTSAY